MVDDTAKTRAFYSRVFGWRFDDTRFPGYTSIDTGSGVGGGLMTRPPGAPGAALHAYFQVDDIQQTLRSAVDAGGTVIVPKTEILPIGWFAMFLDPDQIPIGILEMATPDRP